MTSYAYFNQIISITGADGAPLQSFTVKNGQESVQVEQSGWYNVPDKTSLETVINPTSGKQVAYDVLIKNTSNLTSNVHLDFNLQGNKIGGTTESENPTPDDSEEDIPAENLAPKFNVLVGDKDNFSKGTDFMTILPAESDASGTDRRMVTSGFYRRYQQITNQWKTPETTNSIVVYIKSLWEKDTNIHYFNLNNTASGSVWPGVNFANPTDLPDNIRFEEDSNHPGWLKLTFENTTSVSLVLNKNRDPQTEDCVISEPGEYWLTVSGEKDTKNHYKIVKTYQTYYYQLSNKIEINPWGTPLKRFTGTNSIAQFYGLTYYDRDSSKWTENSTFKYPDNIYDLSYGEYLENKGEVFYDGLTQRAMDRMTTNGFIMNDQFIVGGKDWKALQTVEPLLVPMKANGDMTFIQSIQDGKKLVMRFYKLV